MALPCHQSSAKPEQNAFGVQAGIHGHKYGNSMVNLCYLVAHPTNRKWVITPVISGLTLLIPFITGVIIHLLSGMGHQLVNFFGLVIWLVVYLPL